MDFNAHSDMAAALPFRTVSVSGDDLQVPRHVVRIDVHRSEGKSQETHGWQVRYQGRSKYFSDAKCSPGLSLQKAIGFLYEIYRGVAVPLRTRESRSKVEKQGVPGVRLTRRPLRRKAGAPLPEGASRECRVEIFAEAVHPMKGMPPKRFYIGTSATATTEKTNEGLEKAKAFRQVLEQEFTAFRQAVPQWSAENTVARYRQFVQTRSIC